jgi:hypothetical protein
MTTHLYPDFPKRHLNSLLPPEEQERRRVGAARLRERLLHMPWYKKCEETTGLEYWHILYASQATS